MIQHVDCFLLGYGGKIGCGWGKTVSGLGDLGKYEVKTNCPCTQAVLSMRERPTERQMERQRD